MRHPIRLLLALGLAACTPTAATQPVPEAVTPQPPPERLFSFQLVDASAEDVLRALSMAANEPLVISPNAQDLARCLHLSLLTPEPVPMAGLKDLVTKALIDSSLVLTIGDDGWVVRKKDGAADCSPARAEQRRVPPRRDRVDSHMEEQLLERIRSTAENRYEVPADVVDELLENQSDLMRSARIVPEQQGGKVVGIRLFGVRPGTLLDALGFRNGDRLETINGYPISSPEKALEAYAAVRNASNVKVAIVRRGQPMTLEYVILRR